jgi:hypothetical protein
MYLAPQEVIEIRDSELDLVPHLRLGRQIMMIVQDTEPPQVGNLQVGRKVTRSVEPPEVGHLQVGCQVTQGAEPSQEGHLQVGRQAMLDNRIPEMGHLQVGRKSQAELEALEHVIKTQQVKIIC